MTQHDASSAAQPYTAFPTRAAKFAFAASALSLLLLLLLHIIRADLDPSWHMVSEYAVGSSGWLMALCFASMGLACISLGFALRRQALPPRSRIGLYLLFAAGAGLLMASAFPMDPITVPPEQGSFSGKMHGVSAMIGIPGLIAASLFLSYTLTRHALWLPRKREMVFIAHLSWISLLVMIVSLVMAMQNNPAMEGPGVVGWANRSLMFCYAAWLMLAAWPLIANRKAIS